MAVRPASTSRIPHDPAQLVAEMQRLATLGSGWINVMPEIPDDVEVPATPNALAVFSKRGPFVPMGTWTAPMAGRRGTPEPTDLGLQHGAGTQAVKALDASAGAIPSTWRVLSDNPRRGLVVRPAADASLVEQATWLLDALHVICIPPQTGSFMVFSYDG